MAGNNGRDPAVMPERFAVARRSSGPPSTQTEQLLDGLAERLGGKVQLAVREQMSIEVIPRLDTLESKMEDLSRSRTAPTARTTPAEVLSSREELQRQARNRVD